MCEGLIPIGLLASELGCGTRDLLKRVGASVVVNEAGLRCVPPEISRKVCDERDEALLRRHTMEAEQRRAAREVMALRQAEREAEQERRKRLSAQQRDMVNSGIPAVDVMKSQAQEQKWDRAAEDFVEMTRISPPRKRQ